MANRNTAGFGLIAAGTLGATPSTGGQNKYKIDSGYPTSLYLGMPVQIDSASGANVDAGYLISAQDAITVPTIGVFNGAFYTDANTLKPTFASFYPGGTVPTANANNGDIDAFIIDNPFQLFVGSAAAAVTQANMGRTVSFAAAVPTGREQSGQCTNSMDITGITDTTKQWRIIRSAEDPENQLLREVEGYLIIPTSIVSNMTEFTKVPELLSTHRTDVAQSIEKLLYR